MSNLIPGSGSFGMDEYYYPECFTDGIPSAPHIAVDPWGNYSGGEVLKVDNSFGAFGIKLKDISQALTPGLTYTFSMYVMTQSDVGQIGNVRINANSDANPNEIDPEFGSFSPYQGVVTQSIAPDEGEGMEVPALHNGSGTRYLMQGNGSDASWPGDYAKIATSFYAAVNDQLSFQMWYALPLGGSVGRMGMFYSFPRTPLPDGTAQAPITAFREFELPRAPLTYPEAFAQWQYVNAAVAGVPADYDTAQPFTFGLIFPNVPILVQGCKLIRAPRYETDYQTITAASGWVRIVKTFVATGGMAGVDTPVFLPGVASGVRYNERPIEFLYNIVNTPYPTGSAAPLYVTGFQLVLGDQPVDWQLEYLPMEIDPPKTEPIGKLPKPTIEYLGPITLLPHTGRNFHETKIPQIGQNLSFINYYSSDPVFLNLAKQAQIGRPRAEKIHEVDADGRWKTTQVDKRQWFVVTANGWNDQSVSLSLDAQGYPNSVPSGSKIVFLVARTTPLPWFTSDWHMPHYEVGTYVLKWDGNADIDVTDTWDWLKPGTFDFQVYKRESNRLEIEYYTQGAYQPGYGQNSRNPSDMKSGFWFEISSCDSSFTNLVFCRKEHEALIDQGYMVHPKYLDKLVNYAGIRFMHWQIINEAYIIGWDEHAKLDDAGWCSRGAPLEVYIHVCNLLHKHMWICIPTGFDDNAVRQMAILIRDTLHPNLKVYVEFSNEFWNGGFWQNKWLQEYAYASGIEPDPLDIQPAWTQVIKAFGKRNAECFDIFMDEFSGPRGYRWPYRSWEDPKPRLFRVLSSVAASADTSLQVWDACNKYSKYHQPDYGSRSADCLAPSGYWAHTLGTTYNDFTDLDDLFAKSQQILTDSYLTAGSNNDIGVDTILDPEQIGINVTFYEGNAHLAQGGRPEKTMKFIQWVYSDAAKDQMEQLMDWFCAKTEYNDDNMFYWFENALVAGSSGAFGEGPKCVAVPDEDFYTNFKRSQYPLQRGGLVALPRVTQAPAHIQSDTFFQGWRDNV